MKLYEVNTIEDARASDKNARPPYSDKELLTTLQ